MAALINPTVRRAEDVEHWTHADFMALSPEEYKAELIDGEIIVMSSAFYAHERLQSFLLVVLGFYVDRFGLGQVLGSRTAVYISESNTYKPDILFVGQSRSHIITERELTEAPDLVVEIISASTAKHDRGAKRINYARAGVRELWLIDPYGPSGTQFYQRHGDQLVEVVPMDGIIHSTALPNFKLRTAWLWPNEHNELPNSVDVLKDIGAL